MKYNPNNEYDVRRAKERLEFLISKGRCFEIIDKSKRTISQNNYYHLICAIVATELGCRQEVVEKDYFKALCSPDLFVYDREDILTGEMKKDLRSSKDLTIEEMWTAIQRFKTWALQEQGIYIPDPDEESLLEQAEVKVDNCREFL